MERLYTSSPANSVVICIDEMGPLSVRSYPGKELVRGRQEGLAGRARWELQRDRDRKLGGYVFGAFVPATGEALTATYTSRSIVTFLDFLGKVEEWVPKDVGRIYAIMDNLRAHKAYDVLLFDVARPRWEFVFQPKYAAYLNLIEPWWKTLKSLAIKGRFFETWEQIEEAIAKALDYWNGHRHPYVWGRRRRHRAPRGQGVGAMPRMASVDGV
ncbi:transposase [Rubrobacter tropicus]